MKKPHILKLFGKWHCFTRGHFGIGATPREAHAQWYASRCVEA